VRVPGEKPDLACDSLGSDRSVNEANMTGRRHKRRGLEGHRDLNALPTSWAVAKSRQIGFLTDGGKHFQATQINTHSVVDGASLLDTDNVLGRGLNV
jgi:hypothetical protein